MVSRRRGAVSALLVGATLALCLVVSGAASARTVWLCRPGAAHDPCAPGLSTTVYSPSLRGTGRVIHPRPSPLASRIDCFYAYPTVSDQKGPFANLTIDPEERSIALQQAARYSQLCSVWAPMYRQGTLPALLSGQLGKAVALQYTVPLRSLSAAFHDFITRVDPDRPFVVIAHSQGAILMRRILAAQVDDHPSVRRRMLSAILLGANVLVRRGADVGGDFRHLPGCRTATQLHCVIAYSTFDSAPPADTLFGLSTDPADSVLCTDPAQLAGAHGLATPIYASAPFALGTLISFGLAQLHLHVPHPPTTWVTAPDAYATRCTTGSGPHVLLVTPRESAEPDAEPERHLGAAPARCEHRPRRSAHRRRTRGAFLHRLDGADAAQDLGPDEAERLVDRQRVVIGGRAGRFTGLQRPQIAPAHVRSAVARTAR